MAWKFACNLLTCWSCVHEMPCDRCFEIEIWECAHSIRILSMLFLCSMNLKLTNWPVYRIIAPHTQTQVHHRSTAYDFIDSEIFTYKSSKNNNSNKCVHRLFESNREKKKNRFLPTCAYGITAAKTHTYVSRDDNLCNKIVFVEKEVIA